MLTIHQRADFVDRARAAGPQDIFLKMAILMNFLSESEMYAGERFITVGF
ncbi:MULTISPECIES: hypothetical protein [Sphingobacterium]|nr:MULTISPECIES: hypothetical protein [Sphingobacterium]